MYTQCNHCKAIFLVDMKEVTSTKGQLRCGECMKSFNAVDSLSTTMPEKFKDPNPYLSVEERIHLNSIDDWQSIETNTKTNFDKAKTLFSASNLFLVSLFLLTFLLAAQILYNNPSIYSDNIAERAPEKIEMLNYNIFAHPNEAGVLLISGSMKNNAKHAQPYPSLEVSLTDTQSNLVALSRFSPQDYLSHDTHLALLPVATPVDLRLKIKDPGSNATQFKFSFK